MASGRASNCLRDPEFDPAFRFVAAAARMLSSPIPSPQRTLGSQAMARYAWGKRQVELLRPSARNPSVGLRPPFGSLG